MKIILFFVKYIVMLVPEKDLIEKYIFYKNHDIVYYCQIEKRFNKFIYWMI